MQIYGILLDDEIGNERDGRMKAKKEEEKKRGEREKDLSWNLDSQENMIWDYLFWASLSAYPRYMQLQLSKTKLEVTLRTYCQKYACAKILSGGLAASACLERCKEKYIVLD